MDEVKTPLNAAAADTRASGKSVGSEYRHQNHPLVFLSTPTLFLSRKQESGGGVSLVQERLRLLKFAHTQRSILKLKPI